MTKLIYEPDLCRSKDQSKSASGFPLRWTDIIGWLSIFE